MPCIVHVHLVYIPNNVRIVRSCLDERLHVYPLPNYMYNIISQGVDLFKIYTPRAAGPWLCKSRKTEPSDITDLYYGLCGPDNASTA